MQGKHLYEYAVIRLVPKVEREEFFNVGVILFSKRAGYIKSVCQINEDKLKLYVSEVDRELVFAHLDVFNKICSGAKDGGPIAQLDVPEHILLNTSKCTNTDSRSISETYSSSLSSFT